MSKQNMLSFVTYTEDDNIRTDNPECVLFSKASTWLGNMVYHPFVTNRVKTECRTIFLRNQQTPLAIVDPDMKWGVYEEVDEEGDRRVSDERERDGLGGPSEEAAGVFAN